MQLNNNLNNNAINAPTWGGTIYQSNTVVNKAFNFTATTPGVQPIVELVIIMDRSGSMYNIASDVIGGFNSLIKEQQQLDVPTTATLVTFNNYKDLVLENAPLHTVAELTDKNYVPSGGTALYDTIAMTVQGIANRQAMTSPALRTKNTMCVIVTDGQENGSILYTKDDVFNIIDYAKETLGWEFMFMAANQDAMTAGGAINISADKSVNFSATTDGMNMMYTNLSNSVSSYRSSKI
jgi:uncharacterized protein YegL